jgi:hypothetical protein
MTVKHFFYNFASFWVTSSQYFIAGKINDITSINLLVKIYLTYDKVVD